jgi:hypothetical protein
MNSKLLIAFAAGALLASGIVYMTVREEAPLKISPLKAASPAAIAQKPAPPESPSAIASPPVNATPAPIREKPSPMPPPIRREKPMVVARNQTPPVSLPEVPEKRPDPPPIEAQIPSEPQQPAPAPATSSPQPAQAPQPTPAPENVAPAQPEPEVRAPNTVTITAGMLLQVRIGETISASRNQVGDEFLATLDRPLVVDGFIIAEKGSRVEGRVVQVETASRGSGTSRLGIELVKLSTADGQRLQIRTQAFRKEAVSSTGNDLAKVGVGTVLGAAIGAAAGGGKGAAIGAGAGAVTGAAGAALTRGKAAEIPVETRISFRIANPVTITERLN